MWLYLIKCGVHIQSYVDQTQKDFWVFLVVVFFGKGFCLEKFQKIQNLCNFVLATHSRVKLVASLLKSSRDFLASVSPSREKYLENFSKFLGFWHFRDSI